MKQQKDAIVKHVMKKAMKNAYAINVYGATVSTVQEQ